ncbi:hypothetical protein KIH23_05375 [Flavobacterium sp. CYK-55]|uniref:lysoplasmalogenase family protein n=1 Tax=Flavobacterium sp. CYK-55 TaxID=2835529 RepID=UPI001BCA7C7E|nr:lysoplasmalogenase family protein [Flavobacterium sp. CYK-55]MBS7786719.1 hypothetical protein [Flavobacterium sp. CYK-55]
MKKKSEVLFKKRLIKPFIAIYFFLSLVEVLAEYYNDSFYISLSKPFLMPLLILIYYLSSKRFDLYFVSALVSAWLANLFLMKSSPTHFIIGASFILIYRLLVMSLVLRRVRFPGYVPFVLGCLPFLFIFLFVANVAYHQLSNHFILYLIQGIFMILFGGFCLSSYVIKSSISNTFLLVSTMLFTATQFIVVIKGFHSSLDQLQAVAMLFFAAAQYLLYKFMVRDERKRRRYSIVNQSRRMKA